jgi:hypothetical protein
MIGQKLEKLEARDNVPSGVMIQSRSEGQSLAARRLDDLFQHITTV